MSATTAHHTRAARGVHRWGRYTEHPVSRTMWSSRTLVVFAPGTTTRDAVFLRAWHVWPVLGAVVSVVVMLALDHPRGLGLAAAAGVYALGFGVLGAGTRRTRLQVRSLTTTVFHGNGRPEVHGDVTLLENSLDALLLVERARRSGGVDRVGFEVVWADVWTALPPR
ncbi:hypothetical protein ITJ54_02900 [Curtobacterium sp. VKM Ac-2865]|uniref:DUF6611 family protein n=1 Tax=Curtobacterium sp. VKM Ac-2865 TaxID=2783817 RepID=UPI00188D2763|nr:DUF6611 family protein [Curtobacterium sp. VKM Ac-2865]MBF4581610.1 hypothetical protein [Curtobacterium sp. VKM Ac-2865]